MPTVRLPLRWMVENGEPSGALRAALYLLYVDDVPGASIDPTSDIFDIGHFSKNTYSDPELKGDAENLLDEFDDWWVSKTVSNTPDQAKMEVDPDSPEDVLDSDYVLFNTPGVGTLWK